MKIWGVKITDLGDPLSRTKIVLGIEHCEDEAEERIYKIALEQEDIITMGLMIAEPMWRE